MLAERSVAALDAAYCRALLPRRDPNSHKGTFGTLAIVAGSLDYAGAALLCALSAARAGAGLVALAVPASIQSVFAGRVPEAITLGLPRETPTAVQLIDSVRPVALVVGPGLAENADSYKLLIRLLKASGPPAVVDAGALNLLAGTPHQLHARLRPCVLTPHPGEFGRLTGASVGPDDTERLDRATAFAREVGQVVVLKGARTVVAAPDGRAAVAQFANAALATAGSGDVLSGLIGALIAQGAAPFDAAVVGVYLHGRAGERLSRRLGDAGVLASDIANELPFARHELAQHST